MPPPPTLLDAIREHLVAQGLVHIPRVAAVGAEPPMWLEPQLGVPAPGEGSDPTEIGDPLVLGAFLSGGIPRKPYEKILRRDTVDIWIRSRTAPEVTTIEAAITDQLIDQRNWQMGGLTIIESEQWRPLSPLTRDEHGFTFIVAYWFETYA